MTDDRRQRAEGGYMTQKILSFRDLNVYKMAFELQHEIFKITLSFPKEELYCLKNQLRRSSRSIGANIAESWQKRRYPAHFICKLTDADAEQAETQHWLDTASKCRYISSEEHSRLSRKCKDIGKMIGSMMTKNENFCARFIDK